MEIREMILQTMRAAGKPVSASALSDITGLDKNVINQALALLKKDGDIVSPVRCKWEPKK